MITPLVLICFLQAHLALLAGWSDFCGRAYQGRERAECLRQAPKIRNRGARDWLVPLDGIFGRRTAADCRPEPLVYFYSAEDFPKAILQ